MPATPRPYRDHHAYCDFFSAERCADCVKRCPAGAISERGHDKAACHDYLELVRREFIEPRFGFSTDACGLCQTKVPCESRIPGRSRAESVDLLHRPTLGGAVRIPQAVQACRPALRTTLVGLAAISGALVALPRLAGRLPQSECRGTFRSTMEATPCKATSEGAARQARGSTSSTSACLQPSGARPAGGDIWVERKPRERCPSCGGDLRGTEERRRETKAGFASRKECQAALIAKLTTLAQHTYVPPSHLTLREFLTKVWLPAIEPSVRPTTLSGYRMLVESHLVPQLGAVKLQSLNPSPAQRPLRAAAGQRQSARQGRPLPQLGAPRPRSAASRAARRGEVGLLTGKRGELRRTTPGLGSSTGSLPSGLRSSSTPSFPA